MKSLYSFVVKPLSKRYNNTTKVGDSTLIVNTSIEKHEFVSKKAVVVSTPAAYTTSIKKDDILYVHHNVFRRFYDIRAKEKNSRSFLNENEFIVQPDQIFAYKRNNEWKCVDGYCFVKPIKETEKFSINKEKEGVGIVKYTDGVVEKNSLVGFKPGLEYEFFIEKERLYRIPSNLILMKYEYQGDEEEYNPSWA